MQKVGEQQYQHEIHNMNHNCFFLRLNPPHQVMSSKTVLIHDHTVTIREKPTQWELKSQLKLTN